MNENNPNNTNNPFSTINPKLQLFWDSTSLGWLKSCPRMYQYLVIDGYMSPFRAVDLEFGIMFHTATEIYDHARADGLDHDQALIIALRRAILDSWDFDLSRPWLSDEPTKTRGVLLRTVVWYLDRYRDDNFQTHILPSGKAAVELSFRFPLAEDDDDSDFRAHTGESFGLCGHIDKVIEWNEQLWVVDKKTTKYELDETYFKQYTPDNQVSLYDIAGMIALSEEIGGLIIDGCQVLVNGSRFRRREIPRSPEMREEWLIDLRLWLHQAEMFAENNHWPMNEKSCGYGRRQCQFRMVCSSDPSARNDLLNAHYIKRPWNPLQPR